MSSHEPLSEVLAETAEKLQLYSLLMALEAARSGSLGFAVVADETRKLAEETRQLLQEGEPSSTHTRLLAGQVRLLAQNAYLEGFRARLHLGEAAAAPLILVSQIEEAANRMATCAGTPLQAEALELAAPALEDSPSEPVESVVFRCGKHLIGVEVERVHEIADLHRDELDAPESAPSFVVGLKTRGADLLPILDTEVLLDEAGLPPGAREVTEEADRAARVVILKLGDRDFGLVGDEVLGFVGLVPQQRQPGEDELPRSIRARMDLQAGTVAFPRWNLVADLRKLERFAVDLEASWKDA